MLDKDMFENDDIGELKVKVRDLHQGKRNLDLLYKGALAAKLEIKCNFIEKSIQQSANPIAISEKVVSPLGSMMVDTYLLKGDLELHFIEAELTRNTEMFGKMDPYVEVNYMRQTQRTATH